MPHQRRLDLRLSIMDFVTKSASVVEVEPELGAGLGPSRGRQARAKCKSGCAYFKVAQSRHASTQVLSLSLRAYYSEQLSTWRTGLALGPDLARWTWPGLDANSAPDLRATWCELARLDDAEGGGRGGDNEVHRALYDHQRAALLFHID